MEGRVFKHFYKMQSIHLAFGSTYLNGEDWVKKTISQVLQITHSQWIYRNFSLHDKRRGYLRRQDMKEMMVKIETLLDTRPDEVSMESKFLLEFDHGRVARSNMHNQTYWVVATGAVIKAGNRTDITGGRRKRVHKKHRMNMSRRARLGIPKVEESILLDELAYGSINEEQPSGLFRRQTAIKPLSRRQGSSYGSISANLKSSKRYKPCD